MNRIKNYILCSVAVNKLYSHDFYDAMKVAVIDLGTNTFHLLVAAYCNSDFYIVHKARIPIQLGQDALRFGVISEANLDEACQAMQKFKQVMTEYGVEHYYATATSAFRRAKNGQAAAEQITKVTGIAIEIINGIKEAALIYQGVRKGHVLDDAPAIIADIGGGSLELMIANKDAMLWSNSYMLGVRLLYNRFHKQDPPGIEALTDLQGYLTEQLSGLFDAVALYNPVRLIGCSGVFKTLAKMQGLQQNNNAPLPIKQKAFEELYQGVYNKAYLERLELPGMHHLRAEMIIESCAIVQSILHNTEVNVIETSLYGIKEGLLTQLGTRIQKSVKQ